MSSTPITEEGLVKAGWTGVSSLSGVPQYWKGIPGKLGTATKLVERRVEVEFLNGDEVVAVSIKAYSRLAKHQDEVSLLNVTTMEALNALVAIVSGHPWEGGGNREA